MKQQYQNHHQNNKLPGRIRTANSLLNNPFRFIVSWLNGPFLFPRSVTARLLISVLFGSFVFLFLRIFLPFKLSGIPVDKTLFISVYGINTTVVITIWLFVFPLIWKRMFDPETNPSAGDAGTRQFRRRVHRQEQQRHHSAPVPLS